MPKKINYAEQVKETPEELEALARRQPDRRNADRLRFLRYLKQGLAASQAAAGAMVGLGPRQSQNLWRAYREKGAAGMLCGPPRAWRGRLGAAQLARLLRATEGDHFATQAQVAAHLRDQEGVSYTQPGVHYLLRRLGVKLKTGRPHNVRRDAAGAAVFKKTSRT
jgi:transposase